MNIRKKTIDMILIITLGSLQMLDFLLTWFGINELELIAEANEILAWTFDIPLIVSLTFRFMFVFLIVSLFVYLQRHEKIYFYVMIAFAIGINAVVMYMHYLWLLPYLNF